MAKPPSASKTTKQKATAKSTRTPNIVKKEDVDKVKKNSTTKPVKSEVKKPESKKPEIKKPEPKAEVKKPEPKVPPKKIKPLNPEQILTLITNHIASIVKMVNSVSDRSYSSVTEIVDTALDDLEKNGKLNKQDPISKKLRQDIINSCFFIEDQRNALNKAKNKY